MTVPLLQMPLKENMEIDHMVSLYFDYLLYKLFLVLILRVIVGF